MRLTFILLSLWLTSAMPGSAVIVTVDTSSLAGTIGSLDFQFNPGPNSNHVTNLVISNFVTDGTLNTPSVTGDVGGSLPASVAFDDATQFNDFFVGFRFGSFVRFDVSLSNLGPSSTGAAFGFTMFSGPGGNTPALSKNPNGWAIVLQVQPDGTAALSSFVLANPPTISKTFGAVSIGNQGVTSLTFNLKNVATVLTLTGVAFNDLLPTGLSVAIPASVTGTCGGGAISAAGNAISLSGATLAPGASCTFSVSVKANGASAGLVTNTTGVVTSNEALPSATASTDIFIGDPFQVSYAANLAVGDSAIDITNVGSLGASLQSGTTANITGALCANIYAFTPDEQLVSCCSCPVTPGGLVSLSAKNDLASNTLTPAVPTALVIKLVASLPVGGNCNNSAAAITTASLANGMKSFETTLHATPVAGSYGVTETPFSPATMSAGELSRLANLCNFILANGSGFGVCRSCRLGGLGAVSQ